MVRRGFLTFPAEREGGILRPRQALVVGIRCLREGDDQVGRTRLVEQTYGGFREGPLNPSLVDRGGVAPSAPLRRRRHHGKLAREDRSAPFLRLAEVDDLLKPLAKCLSRWESAA